MSSTRWCRGGWARKTRSVPARLSLSNGCRGLWFWPSTDWSTTVNFVWSSEFSPLIVPVCHIILVSVRMFPSFRREWGFIRPAEHPGPSGPPHLFARSGGSSARRKRVMFRPALSNSFYPSTCQQEDFSEGHPEAHDGRDQNQPGMRTLLRSIFH